MQHGVFNFFHFAEIGHLVQVPVQIMGTLSNIHAVAMPASAMLSTCLTIGHSVVSYSYSSTIQAALSDIHNNYHSFPIFSGDLEVTVEFLVEMDKLVQLIESPIFACKLYLDLILCNHVQFSFYSFPRSFQLSVWRWFRRTVPKLNTYRMRFSVYWCCCHKQKHSLYSKIDYNVYHIHYHSSTKRNYPMFETDQFLWACHYSDGGHYSIRWCANR